MKLSESASKSLDFVRSKVVRKQYDFDQVEKLAIAEVWEEIQFNVSGRKKTLAIGCQSCVADASTILLNFINNHEERVITKKADVQSIIIKHDVKAPKVTPLIMEEKNAFKVTPETTLSELRKAFPHIKATSVKVFLQKLKDETVD